MQGQKDLGFLMNPGEGAISAVALYVPPEVDAPTHLFSGGADGTLAVWSAGRSWDCLKVSVYLMQNMLYDACGLSSHKVRESLPGAHCRLQCLSIQSRGKPCSMPSTSQIKGLLLAHNPTMFQKRLQSSISETFAVPA